MVNRIPIVIDGDVSRKMANFSFLATLLVVAIHVPHGSASDSSLYWFLQKGFPGIFCRTAVQWFFIASGFLMLNLATLDYCNFGWKLALKKRWKSLVIPYISANVIGIIYYTTISLIASNYYSGHNVEFTWRTIPDAFGLLLTGGPIVGQLWYVRCLILLAFISPIIVLIISRSLKSAVITLLILYAIVVVHGIVLGDAPPYDGFLKNLLTYGIPPRGLFYFTVGMTLRIYGIPRVSLWGGGGMSSFCDRGRIYFQSILSLCWACLLCDIHTFIDSIYVECYA